MIVSINLVSERENMEDMRGFKIVHGITCIRGLLIKEIFPHK